ncbi:MAG: hypothetical protein Q9199_002579 [Rusavskia elegans]
MEYPHRLDAAFQLAVCCRLGFGGPLGNKDVDDWLILTDRTVDELDAEIESIRTRDTTKESYYGNQLFQVLLEDGYLLGQLEGVPSQNHFLLEHEKEIGCSHELEAGKHVLTRDESIALKRSIASAIKGQGRYRQARIIFFDLFKTIDTDSPSGLDHPVKWSVASEITTLLRLEGEVNEALAFGTYALSTREKALSRQDLRISYSLKALAKIYIHKGSYDQLKWVGNIATWLDDTGNYYGSEKLYRLQLASTVSWAGPNHPNVALIMSNLAIVIKHQDRYDEAEEYARKAYEINKDVLGPEHHLSHMSLNNLAQILVRLERYDQAETMLSMVAVKYAESLGPYHAHTLSSQLNLAKVFREQKRLEDAKSLQMKVIATYERSPCEDKELIISARSQCATTLHHLGDHDASISSYRVALEAQKALIGEEHPDTWVTMVNLAAVLHSEGQPETQWEEAERLYKFVINRCIDKFWERHTRTLATAFWLAVLWVQMGQVEKAERVFLQTYAGFKEVLGEDNEWRRIVSRCLNGFQDIKQCQAELRDRFSESLDRLTKWGILSAALVFEAQIYLDIQDVMGDDIGRGHQELQRNTNTIDKIMNLKVVDGAWDVGGTGERWHERDVDVVMRIKQTSMSWIDATPTNAFPKFKEFYLATHPSEEGQAFQSSGLGTSRRHSTPPQLVILLNDPRQKNR